MRVNLIILVMIVEGKQISLFQRFCKENRRLIKLNDNPDYYLW